MPDESSPTLTIAAVVGSLRHDSFNRAVLAAATELAPRGVVLREASVADVPLFDQDVEAAGDPAAVTALKAAVERADALVLFTPEYNRSIPAVTKNAVDWLSRPARAAAITDKPVGIVAASPGRGDAPGCRSHLAHTVTGAGGIVVDPTLGIASVAAASDGGVVTDPDVRAALSDWLAAFVVAVSAG